MADESTCQHCWHQKDNMVFATWPPKWWEVCCHCGEMAIRSPDLPDIPDGHGPHYPRLTVGTVTTTQAFVSAAMSPPFSSCVVTPSKKPSP